MKLFNRSKPEQVRYRVDWSKVNTLEDIKLVLSNSTPLALIIMQGEAEKVHESPTFKEMKHLLIKW